MNNSKLTALLLSGALIITASSTAYATEATTTPATTTTQTETAKPVVPKEVSLISVYYNGKITKMTIKPYLDKTKTVFLPIKEVATLTKATLTWNKSTGKATYKIGKNTVQMTVGKDTATINGKSIKLKSKLVNSNGNIYGDLRVISDVLGLKAGYKLGYDKANNNVLSYVVSIVSSTFKGNDPLKSVGIYNGSDNGTSELSIVDRGFENSMMTPEEKSKWYNLYEKMPTAIDDNGDLPTQVLNAGNMYMMSMVATTADSFRPEIIIEYKKEGLITIEIGSLPTKWDYFMTVTLTHLMGSDGASIATRLNKEIWSTYDAKENIYNLQNLKGSFTVGKFTFSYDKECIPFL